MNENQIIEEVIPIISPRPIFEKKDIIHIQNSQLIQVDCMLKVQKTQLRLTSYNIVTSLSHPKSHLPK